MKYTELIERLEPLQEDGTSMQTSPVDGGRTDLSLSSAFVGYNDTRTAPNAFPWRHPERSTARLGRVMSG